VNVNFVSYVAYQSEMLLNNKHSIDECNTILNMKYSINRINLEN